MVTQVIDQVPRVQFVATSGQTIFAYNFQIFVKTDITVEQNGTPLTVDVDFTVSGVGTVEGGNVTLTVGATVSDIMTIYRSQNFNRETDYQELGDFLSETVNADFNRMILMDQQVRESISRSLQYAIDDIVGTISLPVLADRTNKFLGFDNGGNPVALASTITTGTAVSVSSIVALKALTPSNGDTVLVTGYFSDSDGGGGHYQFDSGSAVADNGGRVIAPDVTSGRWIFADTYQMSIEQYGARANDSTDNFASISASLADNGIALIPDSKGSSFNYSGELIIPQGGYIGGYGNGSLLRCTSSGVAMSSTLSGSDPVWTTFRDFRLESITATIGIEFDRAFSAGVYNVNFSGILGVGFTTAIIHFDQTIASNCANIDIIGCSMQQAAGDGILSTASGAQIANIRIMGNRIQANSGTGIRIPDNFAAELSIISNTIEGNTTREIDIKFPFGCAIINNHLEHVDATNPPMRLGNGSTMGATVVMANNINGGGAVNCIELTGTSLNGSQISNNNMTNYTGPPISAAGNLLFSSITNNTVLADDQAPNIARSNTFALGAFAGGGQASATLIKHDLTRISTVATTGDSVKLPIGREGMELLIMNQGANSCNVFPQSGSQIDDLGSDVAKALAVNESLWCVAFGASDWETFTLIR